MLVRVRVAVAGGGVGLGGMGVGGIGVAVNVGVGGGGLVGVGGGAPLPMLLGLITVFAAGILLSMSLFGVAFAGLMTARVVARLGRAAAGAMAIASIALGVFWIVRA